MGAPFDGEDAGSGYGLPAKIEFLTGMYFQRFFGDPNGLLKEMLES